MPGRPGGTSTLTCPRGSARARSRGGSALLGARWLRPSHSATPSAAPTSASSATSGRPTAALGGRLLFDDAIVVGHLRLLHRRPAGRLLGDLRRRGRVLARGPRGDPRRNGDRAAQRQRRAALRLLFAHHIGVGSVGGDQLDLQAGQRELLGSLGHRGADQAGHLALDGQHEHGVVEDLLDHHHPPGRRALRSFGWEEHDLHAVIDQCQRLGEVEPQDPQRVGLPRLRRGRHDRHGGQHEPGESQQSAHTTRSAADPP